MKKHISVVTLIAAALVGSALANDPDPTPTPKPSTKGGCNLASWNPELYSFYGAKDPIVEKLATIPAKLSERRVFLQITQGDSSAHIKLYERQKNGTFTVTDWTAKETSGLVADIDKAILANKGVNCVGEQVKSILAKELHQGQVSTEVPAPASPEAAFKHSVQDADGKFIETTIIILC